MGLGLPRTEGRGHAEHVRTQNSPHTGPWTNLSVPTPGVAARPPGEELCLSPALHGPRCSPSLPLCWEPHTHAGSAAPTAAASRGWPGCSATWTPGGMPRCLCHHPARGAQCHPAAETNRAPRAGFLNRTGLRAPPHPHPPALHHSHTHTLTHRHTHRHTRTAHSVNIRAGFPERALCCWLGAGGCHAEGQGGWEPVWRELPTLTPGPRLPSPGRGRPPLLSPILIPSLPR